jgi:hypothetical protein
MDFHRNGEALERFQFSPALAFGGSHNGRLQKVIELFLRDVDISRAADS